MAMIASSKGGAEVQDKPSGQHRAKGTALDTAARQIMVFAGGEMLLPSTWDVGEQALRDVAVPPGVQEEEVWAAQFHGLKMVQSEKASGFIEVIPESAVERLL